MPQEEKKQILKKEKDEADQEETAVKDFATWFPKPEYIETLHEERIKVPILTAGKEAKIFQSLARLLEKLPKNIFQGDLEEFEAADLLKILPNLLKDAPREAFSMASEILTSKEHPLDEKWVQDNLNFDKIFDLIIPFVAGEAQLFERVSGIFEKIRI